MDQNYLALIRKQFPIDTGSASRLTLDSVSPSTRVYSVKTSESPLIREDLGECFLLDTPQAQRIASHPHLVGTELADLSLAVAHEFKSALLELGLIGDSTGLLHILRGSSGYMVNEAISELPLINIRTEYKEDGYRAHSDDSRRIEVTYSDYHGQDIDTLIIPDTYATGRSVEAALVTFRESGHSPKTVIIYGFIAIPAIKRLHKLCQQEKCRLITVALCDITQLAANHYDMALFGPDEHLHTTKGELNNLGSIVGEETLEEMAENFIPGLDQPGDWSERQVKLFNGHDLEDGDIRGHLSKSIKFIEELDKINRTQEWYNEQLKELVESERKSLHEILSKY